MTIREFIDNLPHHRRLSEQERLQLSAALFFNAAVDSDGVALIAYMPDTAMRMLKLLKIAGWHEMPTAGKVA